MQSKKNVVKNIKMSAKFKIHYYVLYYAVTSRGTDLKEKNLKRKQSVDNTNIY